MGTSAAPGSGLRPAPAQSESIQSQQEPDILLELEQLAKDVEKEVGRDEPGTIHRLQLLKQALTPGTEAQGWAGINVVRALNGEGVSRMILGRSLKDRKLGEMERVRNILALLPVLLTWAGLAVAGISYKLVTDANPALLTRPFLLLWEEGFPGGLSVFGIPLGRIFTLSHIAMLDVVLLTIMVVLTWKIHLELNIHQARREQVAQRLRRRIEDVGWRAALLLAHRNSPRVGVDVFKSASDELLNEMRAWNAEIERLAAARAQQTAALVQATGSFNDVARDLSGMTRDAKSSFDLMIQIVTQLGDRIIALERQQGQVEEALGEIGPALREHADATEQGLTTHAATLHTSLGQNADAVQQSLEQNADTVQRSLGQNADAVQQSLEQSAEIVQRSLGQSAEIVQRTLGQSADAVQRSLEQHAGAITTGVSALTASAREFQKTAEQAIAATQEIRDSARKIEGVLAQMQTANSQQLREQSGVLTGAVKAVEDVVADLHEALSRQQTAMTQAVRQGIEDVAAATKSVSDSVGRIGGAVSSLERRVDDERRGYDLAAGAAEDASRALNGAIRATVELTHSVHGTAQQVAGLAEPLAGIEQRLQELTDDVTGSTGSMTRSVNAFAGSAEQTRDRLSDTADDLGQATDRLAALLRALEKQAAESAGIHLGRRRVPWDPRTW